MQASILPIKPFDANTGTVINFEYQGNSVIAIRCIIKENTAEATVKYDGTYTISSDASGSNANIFSMTYTVPKASSSYLENGNWYNAFILVSEKKDTSGSYVWSEMQSVGESFKCIATPSFTFVDLPTEITKASHTFTLRYSYNINTSETLRSWIINIYDTSKTVVATSNTVYEDMDANVGKTRIDNQYFVDGFNDNATYYIKAFGETENGMLLETDESSFIMHKPDDDKVHMLKAKNIECKGGIQLESNIIIIPGVQDHDGRYIYDDYGNPIMLSTRGNALIYREGFKIDNECTISIVAADIDQNETFLKMSNSVYNASTGKYSTPTMTMQLRYITGFFGTPNKEGMFELIVTDRGITTMYFSNKVSALIPEDLVQVTITRKEINKYETWLDSEFHNGYMWNLGARIVATDDRIHIKSNERATLTPEEIAKYTARQIELGYPLDFH